MRMTDRLGAFATGTKAYYALIAAMSGWTPMIVHDAREIVGQHVQRHLGGNPWQRLHQEVGCAHPGLDRAEGMLDRLAPLAHFLRMLVEPALHCLENVLMLPSGDPSLLANRAAVLDGAALAGVGPVAA